MIFDEADPEEVELVRYNRSRFARNIWAKFPSGGRTPEEAFSDPLAHHDYRIQSYVLDVTVDKGTKLHGRAEVNLEITRGGERVLLFELDPNLRATSIATAVGQPLFLIQVDDPEDKGVASNYLLAVSSQPFAPGPLTLRFEYSGKRVVRKVGTGNFFCRSFGWYPTYGAGRISMTTNFFADTSDFDITLRVPKRYTTVAVGSKTEDKKEKVYRMTRWKSDIPIRVAGFAYGDYKVIQRKYKDVTVEIYANKRPDDFLRSIEMFARGEGQISSDGPITTGLSLGSLSPARLADTMAIETVNALQVMEMFFGPYPYKKLAISNIPYGYGQGWPGLIYLSARSFLDSTQRQQLGVRDHVRATDYFRAHEISHQWWGHVVAWKSYHDQWLSEGFANFSGTLYTLFSRNPKEYQRLLRLGRQRLQTTDRGGSKYDDIGPIYAGQRLSSGRHRDAYSVLVYSKGGWVLHMIRMMLYDSSNAESPDARFIVMMKDFTRTHYNDAASTEDFKRIVEKHMLPAMDIDGNGTMDWFFDAYVYGTGIPKYKFSYTLTPAEQQGQWVLKGSILQSRVHDGFRTILPLYFHQGKDKMRAGWLTARGPETPFETVLPFKPDKVTLNDMEEILAAIEYD